MQPQEIHDFLQQYFTANECEILENSSGHFTVQLTVALDKELMNRPFYWHYLEKTGGVPNPMKLTFITDQPSAPQSIKGEAIYFGSPRLHQIFQSTKNLARYIRLYEEITPIQQQTPLLPWICLNVKISYQCDRKRDLFKSIGLQLINGQLVEGFQDVLNRLTLIPKIPDYAFTLSPLIKPQSGIVRIENYLKGLIDAEDHAWAHEAEQRWKQDLHLLEHFFENEEDKTESYETEKQALQQQYEPKVVISFINGGLFYLTEKAI